MSPRINQREKHLVFVYISTIFKLTDLFILYFFIQNVYTNKNYLGKKGIKLCIRGVSEIHSFLKY